MSSHLTLKIPGLIPSFKNGKMWVGGRPITDPKKQKAMKFISLVAKSQVPRSWYQKGKGHYSMSVHFLLPDKRVRDLDGMNTTLLDCLVKVGILPDDRWTVIPEQSQTAALAPDGEAVTNVVIQFFPEITA